MISKTKIKFIKSLQLKKNREQTHLFIAEGHKLVEELLAMSRAHTLVATQEWLANHSAPPADEVIEVTSDELRKVSLLQHPQQVLGLFPFFASDTHAINTSTLSLMLDGIQDPGNLGTIIRIADWFGINDIYNEQLSAHGLIIMGNEGNGISAQIRQMVNCPLLIPNYPPNAPTAESLNVAIATAITCAEFRRRIK